MKRGSSENKIEKRPACITSQSSRGEADLWDVVNVAGNRALRCDRRPRASDACPFCVWALRFPLLAQVDFVSFLEISMVFWGECWIVPKSRSKKFKRRTRDWRALSRVCGPALAKAVKRLITLQLHCVCLSSRACSLCFYFFSFNCFILMGAAALGCLKRLCSEALTCELATACSSARVIVPMLVPVCSVCDRNMGCVMFAGSGFWGWQEGNLVSAVCSFLLQVPRPAVRNRDSPTHRAPPRCHRR